MPVLTRSAQKALNATEWQDATALSLRESVTKKADAVWAHRGDVDVYSLLERSYVVKPQVDHQLEVQLVEMAFVWTYADHRGKAHGVSIAAAQAAETLRTVVNNVHNLNVTSARHNQAKRGPMIAALNRLQNDRLRTVDIEQLARQGKAKWMIDNGDWARIERAIVQSYDEASDKLCGSGSSEGLPSSRRLVHSTVEELGSMLDQIGLR